MNKKLKKVLWLSLAVFWMGVLFYFSSQPVVQSRGFSMIFADKFVEIFKIESLSLGMVNHYIRKSAHFISYMVLSIILMNIFRVKDQPLFKSMVMSLVLSFIFACTDEFHQLFVDGRGGQIRDVVLDTSGASFGIIMYGFIFRKKFKRKDK